MKKSALLAAVCALFIGSSAVAQQNQEVTYVEDASQGLLINDFKSNWFITGEVGASVYAGPLDQHRALKDRFTPAAGIYVGKWFTPIFGARIGGNWLQSKGLSAVNTFNPYGTVNGYYKQKFNHFGPALDLMVNLTNWWCGYNANRVYNATVYAGLGGFFTFTKDSEGEWSNAKDDLLTIRAGLLNSFRVSKRVQLSLDLRWNGLDNHTDKTGSPNEIANQFSAYLGFTYNFGKTTWSAPVVPVCPEPENCDALRARLASAEGRIADLENQLRDCLNRPTQAAAAEKAPLATIYYPINSYKLTKKDVNVLQAVSEVMKENSSKNYVLTGWADNYTGNDQVNERIRQNRVNGVQKQLVNFGVNASQLTATTNSGNLCDLGEKYVALDRAVTIEEAE